MRLTWNREEGSKGTGFQDQDHDGWVQGSRKLELLEALFLVTSHTHQKKPPIEVEDPSGTPPKNRREKKMSQMQERVHYYVMHETHAFYLFLE